VMTENCLLVFYDTELSKETITQVGAICEAGEFNRWMIPEGEFVYDWGATKYSTKVTAKVDPSDNRQKLYHTLDKVFLPTVSSSEALNDFLLWLEKMKMEAAAASVSLLSWSSADHSFLLKNLVANGEGLKERLLEVQGERGKMLDAQFIVKTLLEPEKLNLGFVFKKLLPSEEFREHNALEDAKAMYRVFEEVKTISSLDNVGMTKLCPAFDPKRDREVKTALSKVLDSVMQKSNPGWLDEAIDKALLGEENLDKIFSSRKLKEAVIEVQDRRKTSEVESMLATLSFSDQQVAKICEDPFKSLNTLVAYLNVQVNKATNKKSHSSVKLTAHERTVFRKNWNLKEAKRGAAMDLLWSLLEEGKVRKVDLE